MSVWKVEFDFGTGYEEIECSTPDFIKNEVLYTDLKPAETTVSFSVVPSTTLNNKLKTFTSEVPVKISKDTVRWFTGYIRKTFSFKKIQRDQPIKIECVTAAFLLKKKISVHTAYTSVTVSGLINNLLLQAGVTAPFMNIPTISNVIPAFLVEADDGKIYYDIISTLLYEYGYVLSINELGVFGAKQLFLSSTTTSQEFNGLNCLNEITQEKKEETYERTRVEWTTTSTLTGQTIFSDTTGATGANKCQITILPEEYYSPDPDIHTWNAEYKIDGKEIIYCYDVVQDIIKDSDISITFVPGNVKAALTIYNTSTLYSQVIRKLDLKGTAILKGDRCFSECPVAPSEKQYEYAGEYLYSKVAGDALANGLASYYSLSDFTYTLSSKVDYALGTCAIINEMGSVTARIIQKKTNALDGIINYTLEAISEYTPELVTNTITGSRPAPISAVLEAIIANVPTLVYDGYITSSGGTTTPAALSVSSEAGVRAITIRWNAQNTLTNLKEYRIQVSTDNTNWYALRFDRVSPAYTTLNAYTTLQNNMIVHTLPDNIIADVATIWTLYYRVKQVTRAGTESAWTAITAYSTLIDTGDIALNAVSANQIQVSVLQAMIGNFNEYVTISDTGFTGQTFSVDDDAQVGDARMFLDQDEITRQTFTAGTPNYWKEDIVLGRGTANLTLDSIECNTIIVNGNCYNKYAP